MNTPQTQPQDDDFLLTGEQLDARIGDINSKGTSLAAQAFANSPHYFRRLLKRYIQAKQDITLLKKYAENPLPDDQVGDLAGPSLPARLNNAQIIEQLHSTLKSFHQFFTSRGNSQTNL